MASGDPSWLAPVLAIASAFATAGAAAWVGHKKDPEKAVEGALMAGALVDSRSVKELTEAVRETDGAIRRELRHLRETCDDMRDALRENTDSHVNMVRFLSRREEEHKS